MNGDVVRDAPLHDVSLGDLSLGDSPLGDSSAEASSFEKGSLVGSESLFDYTLPPERIAQWPVSREGERTDSRLLLVQKRSNVISIEDRRVADLSDYFLPGDYLILNNTRVRPARFFVPLEGSPSAEGEIFLLSREADGSYLALAKPMKKLESAQGIGLAPGVVACPSGRDGPRLRLRLTLVDEFTGDRDAEIERRLQAVGGIPIPPYIRKGRSEISDSELYQTVFARHEGSVAAPTAGLHFTEALLERLRSLGVLVREITLHVGTASFHAARQQDPNLDRLDPESYSIDPRLFEELFAAKSEGARITAVGTTTTRALESYALLGPSERSAEFRSTELCIKPGFRFQIVDRLFTNFHQPGSTHLMLVSAFSGADSIRSAYNYALRNGYRFLSYGDAMLLDPAVRTDVSNRCSSSIEPGRSR